MPFDAPDRGPARQRLLAWYAENRRDLPWRGLSDPYAIWISEVMLQQTQVETVKPYFARFMARWPTLPSLAKADPEALFSVWSGLGYYRRARLMHQASQVVLAEHGGELPADLDQLRALPGFGAYTAAAVASIAFGIPAAAVDGNVRRVLARYRGITGDLERAPFKSELEAEAALWPSKEAPGDLTQALIEVGALCCRPRKPDCPRCPLQDGCVAFSSGIVDEIPKPKTRRPPRATPLLALLLFDQNQLWLKKRPKTGIFSELWCPPLTDPGPDPSATLADFAASFGLAQPPEHVGELVHVLTHRRLEVSVYRANAPENGLKGASKGRWFALDTLASHGLPSFSHRVISLARVSL